MTERKSGDHRPRVQRAELPKPPYVSPDGVVRRPEHERQINDAFATVFQGKTGDMVVDYLRSITLHRVIGPSASAEELRHQEGMRGLTAIIETRIRDGRNRRPENG